MTDDGQHVTGPASSGVPVVLSYGLGVDSTAVLTRWLLEPESRDFDVQNLTVVTAMVGDEFSHTTRLVETHILPMLAAHSVRYLQVARASASQTDGIVVLDDSRHPTELFSDGAFTLSNEMRNGGLVPQRTGRTCSIKSKGVPLDRAIQNIVDGAVFDHHIGFESNEKSRAHRDQVASAKSAVFTAGQRRARFPLIEWGWDRAHAETYLRHVFGVDWPKSCCVYCPFSMSSRQGIANVLDRYAAEPAAGQQSLLLEHSALALNPTQTLTGHGALAEHVNDPTFDQFVDTLTTTPTSLVLLSTSSPPGTVVCDVSKE